MSYLLFLCHCWTVEPPFMSLHIGSCYNNWFLSALWPALWGIWLAGCCDRHCADGVSVRARALAQAAWSAVCAHTYEHTFYNHTPQFRRKRADAQRHMCLVPNTYIYTYNPTQTMFSSLHPHYYQLYHSCCVYVPSSQLLSSRELWSHHYLFTSLANSHMSLWRLDTLCRNLTRKRP